MAPDRGFASYEAEQLVTHEILTERGIDKGSIIRYDEIVKGAVCDLIF